MQVGRVAMARSLTVALVQLVLVPVTQQMAVQPMAQPHPALPAQAAAQVVRPLALQEHQAWRGRVVGAEIRQGPRRVQAALADHQAAQPVDMADQVVGVTARLAARQELRRRVQAALVAEAEPRLVGLVAHLVWAEAVRWVGQPRQPAVRPLQIIQQPAVHRWTQELRGQQHPGPAHPPPACRRLAMPVQAAQAQLVAQQVPALPRRRLPARAL